MPSRRSEDEPGALSRSRAEERMPGLLVAFVFLSFQIGGQGDGVVRPANGGIGNDVPKIERNYVDRKIIEAVRGVEDIPGLILTQELQRRAK
jgi:hypothetical protein